MALGSPGNQARLNMISFPNLHRSQRDSFAPLNCSLRCTTLYHAPVLNTIAFLAGEYPDEAARLAQYVSAVENALQAPEYKALKSVKSRASFIADAMAGAHWELAPSYARQKAEEARKLLKRSKAQEQ